MGGGIARALKAGIENPVDGIKMSADPGGLFHQSKNEDIRKQQAVLDIGGIGQAPRERVIEMNELASEQQDMNRIASARNIKTRKVK